MRQAPATANNTTFVTLEDETGVINLIVWSSVSQKYRNPFLPAHLLEVRGKFQNEKGVMHVIVEDMVDRTRWLGALRTAVRNFGESQRVECAHLHSRPGAAGADEL